MWFRISACVGVVLTACRAVTGEQPPNLTNSLVISPVDDMYQALCISPNATSPKLPKGIFAELYQNALDQFDLKGYDS